MGQVSIEKQTFELIKGDFTPDEAKEILFNLLNKKINFHKDRNWSSQERLGQPDNHSLERIKVLTASKTAILEMIEDVKKQGTSLRVNASISIESV